MKSVLLSIQPKWCELIASGEKTVEIRKTKPKMMPPFKCYIYCTKSKTKNPNEIIEIHSEGKIRKANGKVIGEFICDEISGGYYVRPFSDTHQKETCLTYDEIEKYSKGKPVKSWHISDFVLYDKPKSLGDFNHCGDNYHFNPPVMKPPQSWCYVEEQEG